jgi:hypothetical protein
MPSALAILDQRVIDVASIRQEHIPNHTYAPTCRGRVSDGDFFPKGEVRDSLLGPSQGSRCR